jgi:tetratricopeptide (TPR) repeat protein
VNVGRKIVLLHRIFLLVLTLLPQDRPEVEKPAPRTDEQRRELDARKLYADGVLQAKRGQFLDAVKSFEAVLKLDPEALPPRRMLATHYLTIGRPDEALAMAREVTEKAPGDSAGWRVYADQLKDLGRPKEAIAALQKATMLPGAGQTPEQLVAMLKRLAEWQRDAGDGAAAATLRLLLTVLDRNREAFRKSQLLDDEAFADEKAAAHERLGEVLLKLDRMEDALREFDLARAVFKGRDDTKARVWQHRLHWQLARLHHARKDYAAAYLNLQAYLQDVTPGSMEPYRLLAELLLQVDPAKAATRFAEYARDEKNLPLQMLAAETFARAGQDRVAEERYLKLARKEPRPDIYHAVFMLYERLGPAGDVLRLLDEQNDIVEKPDAGEEEKKKAQEHVRAMSAALLKQPSLILRLLPLANEEKLQRLRNGNFMYGTFSQLAWLIAQTDRLDDAERLFRDALVGRGRFFTVSYDIALMRVLERRHKYADIRSICRDRLQNLNNIPNGNLNEGLYSAYLEDALYHLGDVEEALRVNEQTVLLAPNESEKVRSRLQRAELLHQAGKLTEALAECEKLQKEYPQPKYTRLVRLRTAAILSHAHRPAEAEKVLRRMLEDDPNDAAALNSLGYELADQSRSLDDAERMIRRALELDRRARKFGEGDDEAPAAQDEDRASYLDSLAWVLFRRGKLGEARATLEQAVAQRDGRDDPALWDHLGDIRYRQGELGKAREAWGKAHELYGLEPLAKKDGRQDEVSRKLNVLK